MEVVGDSGWRVQERGYVVIVGHFEGGAPGGGFPVDEGWIAGYEEGGYLEEILFD